MTWRERLEAAEIRQRASAAARFTADDRAAAAGADSDAQELGAWWLDATMLAAALSFARAVQHDDVAWARRVFDTLQQRALILQRTGWRPWGATVTALEATFGVRGLS